MATKRPNYNKNENSVLENKSSQSIQTSKDTKKKSKSKCTTHNDFSVQSKSAASTDIGFSNKQEQQNSDEKVYEWIQKHVNNNPSVLNEHLSEFDPFEIGCIFTRLCCMYIMKSPSYYGYRIDGQIYIKLLEDSNKNELVLKNSRCDQQEKLRFVLTKSVKIKHESKFYVIITCPANKKKKTQKTIITLWVNTEAEASEIFKILIKHRK